MVDPGYPVGDLRIGGADVAGQFGGRIGHAVAQAHVLDFRVIADRPRDDRHRVGVVQQPGIGAQLFHIVADIQDGRYVARAVEHSTRTARVGDGLVDAVFERDFFFWTGGFVAAHPDGHDHVIRPGQGFTAVGGRLDLCIKPVLMD